MGSHCFIITYYVPTQLGDVTDYPPFDPRSDKEKLRDLWVRESDKPDLDWLLGETDSYCQKLGIQGASTPNWNRQGAICNPGPVQDQRNGALQVTCSAQLDGRELDLEYA